MAFDINLPRTPPKDSSVVSWAFWVARAEAAVACSLAADTASVVASLARAAADAFAGAKPSD